MEKTTDHRANAKALEIDTRPFIDGARMSMDLSQSFETIHPFDGCVVAQYPTCSADVVKKAVDIANAVFKASGWSDLPVSERTDVIVKWAKLIETNAEELASLDTLEMGMPFQQALQDVKATAQEMISLAHLAKSLKTDAGVTAPGTLCINTRDPLGVVAVITPWNFPLNQSVMKIIPALLMGNAVVAKPSEVASASTLRAADLSKRAGVPDGILNVLTGPGDPTGTALVKSSNIRKISFTGSEKTGSNIQAQSASSGTPKPMLMELGGKSPHIVTESFGSPDGLADAIAAGIFWNSGQVCSAGSHLIVHESCYDPLLDALRDAANNFVPGDPFEKDTAIGPIATRQQFNKIVQYMRVAESEGARPVVGGLHKVDLENTNLLIPPTIYEYVDPTSDLALEELFGPILIVSKYKTKEEALSLAHQSGYGLTATVWSKDMFEGLDLSRRLQSATVTLHATMEPLREFSPTLGFEPYGRSGFGSDFGMAQFEQFSRLKLITVNSG
ncbi:MAG: aldehyde dehydrogenase family protein [Pseudomonadota bacterium]